MAKYFCLIEGCQYLCQLGDALAVVASPTVQVGHYAQYKCNRRTDLGDAVEKLDQLAQEEALMALVEVLKVTHIVHDDVRVVDSKLESINDKAKVMGGKVAELVTASDRS
ncbi:hypothetical protein H4582DRAFT_2053597 [Lactarius indigo]|nr:hypothetical protein H4582DRAFT_2053597 [Lactarius indigo]